jgi:DNA polymerase-1
MLKNNFAEILANIKNTKEEPLHAHSKVLLIDSMNTFLRSFAMINHINPNGHHIGGLTGFLKSLGFIIRHIKPTRVILVFDGVGSTHNKKNLYAEYKGNRSITRITNFDGFSNRDEESEAITHQLLRLIEYIKCLPVDMISIDKIEADDVIGYLTSVLLEEVVVMSADKDFLQLVSKKVSVYSPIKKIYYTPTKVKEEFGLYPHNYINYKILLGDMSDNLPGVKGIGPKKLFKLFPELEGETYIEFKDLMRIARDKRGENALYESICNFEKQLNINSKLMNIRTPIIPEADIEEITYILNNPSVKFDKARFIRMYNEDLLGESIQNLDFWINDVFSYLLAYKLKK